MRARRRRSNDLCDRQPRYWASADTHCVPIGAGGIAFGRIFEREGKRQGSRLRDVRIDDDRPNPGDLVQDCWGNYLAVIMDDDGINIFLDPSGLMPAFSCQTTSHFLVASHAGFLFEAGGLGAAIDFPALRRFLERPTLRPSETCLAGVRELAPGAVTTISGGKIHTRQHWRAADHLPRECSPSFAEAASALRDTAIRVMSAWHDVHAPVAVAVSGGVDSSLICGALAAAGANFSCITLATPDPSGDERVAARQLAAHLGVRLHEAVYDPARFDPWRCASEGLPRPSRKAFLTSVDDMLSEASAPLGARSIWDGNGGDNLFCYLHSAAPVADRIRAEGLLSRWPQTLIDMCRATGSDIGAVLKATLRRLTRHGEALALPADQRLLAHRPEDHETQVPPIAWTAIDPARHKGKRDHLALIIQAQFHGHGLGQVSGRFSPLMSQPLLELCISLPTWLWFQGGINRSLARQAFAAELPQSILVRTSKAGPDSYLRAIFQRNRAALRDLLLGGALAREDIVDVLSLEEAFAADRDIAGQTIYRLLDLTEAENWVRTWKS